MGVYHTRKCSRCKMHHRYPAKGWGSYYCPPCHRSYQRERRATARAEGRAQWRVKTCTQCGTVEKMPPESAWCRQCRNSYQRQWKREHPHNRKMPPNQPVSGREPLQTCSKCKKSRPYNRKEFARGNVCQKCYQGYQRKADANEKAKFRLWRETGAMIECHTCNVVQVYGVGWDGRRCPACQAVRAKKLYEEIQADPVRRRHRKAQQEEARRKRQLTGLVL